MEGKLQTLIFDMDGVIIDSEPLQIEAERWVCEKYGLNVPLEEWRNFKGKTNRDIFQYIADRYAAGNIPVAELVSAKREYYFKSADTVSLIPGVLEFIRTARRKVSKIGLTTSSSRPAQQFVFNKFALAGYFDAVTTGDEVKRGKPHPEPYLVTLERLGSSAEGAYVIEDSDNGVISGKAAGCAVIGITTSFPRGVLEKAGADFVIDSYKEAYQFLTATL